MNGSTRANIALTGALAAILTPYAEKKFHIAITADDIMAAGAIAFALWHGFVATVGPYAQRVFDHYFPPPPAQVQLPSPFISPAPGATETK